MELTLNKLIDLMLKKIWLIVLIVILSGVSAFAISKFAIQPKYQSSVTLMIIINDSDHPIGDTKIKANYMDFTGSDTFLKGIEENLTANLEDYGLSEPITAERIKRYVTVTQNNTNSLAFDVIVVAEDSNIAYYICKEIENSAAQIYKREPKLAGLIRGTDIVIINQPTLNTTPVSPNVTLNTIVGVFLGIILSFLTIIVLHMVDNSIKDEDDLVDNYDIPLLGIVYSSSTDELSDKGGRHEKA